MRVLQWMRCRLSLHAWDAWERMPRRCQQRRACRHCGEVETLVAHELDGCKCIRCGEIFHDFSSLGTSWEECEGAWDSDFGSYDSVEVEHMRCRRCGVERDRYTGRRNYV
jgi:hypothetical protein